MNKNSIKTCLCCAKEYIYDPQKHPRYMYKFCSENCKEIFETVAAYNAGGKITVARVRLGNCDLSDVKDMNPSIRKAISKINKQPKKKKKTDE